MTDDVVAGIFAVDEGDEVDVATNNYSWSNPMEVTDVDHVEWDAAHGEGWATRTVVLVGGYSTEYVARCVTEQDDAVRLRRGENGEVRGLLEQFDIVGTDDDNRTAASITSDCNGDEDGADEDSVGDEEDENEGDSEDEFSSVTVHDDEIVDTLDEAAPDDADQDDDDEDSSTLPDGVTAAGVDDAANGNEYLEDVADELGIPESKARSVLVHCGRYTDVKEGSRYRGEIK